MPPYVAMPRNAFPDGWASGDRIQTTDAYAEQFPTQPRTGVIVGGSRTPGCCRVMLDGHQAAMVVSFNLLKRVAQ